MSPSNSISESFGLSIVEAMLHAVPIVCTSWSGYREIVRDGIDGFLVETYWNAPQAESMEEVFVMSGQTSFSDNVAVDTDQLAHYLGMLLEDEKLRRRLGRSARARALARFLIDHTVEHMIALFRDLRDTSNYESLPPRPIRFLSSFAPYASKQRRDHNMGE